MTILKFQKSPLYISKIYRAMKGDYSPLPCYATLQLDNIHVIQCICDCKTICKFTPITSTTKKYVKKYAAPN